MMRYRSYPFFHYQFGKMLEGAVVSFFRVFRKAASRQLPFGQMIGDAVAADAFAAARVVRAVTSFQIIFFFAFHKLS